MADPLKKARTLRAQRALILESLQNGTLSLRDALLDPPVPLKGATLYAVLISTEGMGPQTAKKVCTETRTWPLVPVGHLSLAARQRIIEALPERID